MEKFGEVSGIGVFGHGDAEDDEPHLAGVVTQKLALDALRRFRAHRAFALRAGTFRQPREDHFQVVIDLRDGADGGARAADIVDLLDGNGGRDAFDAVHQRLVHALKELARVRRKGLDVTALPLGIDGVEGQRRLARAARAGDDVEFADGQVQVDALQIVLPRPANANDVGGSFRLGLGGRTFWHGAWNGGTRGGGRWGPARHETGRHQTEDLRGRGELRIRN